MFNWVDKNDIEMQAYLSYVCHELGIVPADPDGNWIKVEEKFKNLPEQQVTLMKRKWRKLWRAAYDNKVRLTKKRFINDLERQTAAIDGLKTLYGVGQKVITQKEKTFRKILVIEYLKAYFINPMQRLNLIPEGDKTVTSRKRIKPKKLKNKTQNS